MGDVIFAFSGSPNLATEVQDKIIERLTMHEANSKSDITGKEVRDIVDEVLTEMGRLNGVFSGILQFLIGVYPIWEPPQLLSFDGQAVHAVRGTAVLGCGGDTSIVRFLCDRLYDPSLNCIAGARIGAYLVKKATQYVDGCGEPIDVMILSGPKVIKLEAEEVTRSLELMESQEKYLFTLLVQKPFQP
jgi:20S proteasome alpha/beta subunit